MYNISIGHKARELAKQNGVVPIIPMRAINKQANDTFDSLYKEPHTIENLFAKLKQYRAIATRYDKLGRNYLALVYIAAGLVWLR